MRQYDCHRGCHPGFVGSQSKPDAPLEPHILVPGGLPQPQQPEQGPTRRFAKPNGSFKEQRGSFQEILQDSKLALWGPSHGVPNEAPRWFSDSQKLWMFSPKVPTRDASQKRCASRTLIYYVCWPCGLRQALVRTYWIL